MRRRIRLIKVKGVRRRGQRNQGEHVLALNRRPSPARLSDFYVHHPVHPGFLRDDLVTRVFRGVLRRVRASAVPGTSHVVSGDDLDEAASLYVPDLDKSAVEEEDIWWMPGDPFCCAFPLYCADTTWVSVFIDVQPELCVNC
jgi:hypothetical protein